jgi:hypothetical protein
MVLAVTLAGWIFIGVVGGLALYMVLRLAWMFFVTNEEMLPGGSFGSQASSKSARRRRFRRR